MLLPIVCRERAGQGPASNKNFENVSFISKIFPMGGGVLKHPLPLFILFTQVFYFRFVAPTPGSAWAGGERRESERVRRGASPHPFSLVATRPPERVVAVHVLLSAVCLPPVFSCCLSFHLGLGGVRGRLLTVEPGKRVLVVAGRLPVLLDGCNSAQLEAESPRRGGLSCKGGRVFRGVCHSYCCFTE